MDLAVPLTKPQTADDELLTPERESQIFWRLRRQVLRRSVFDKLRTARLRISLIVGLSLLFWIGLYLLFCEGFRFLAAEPEIIPRLFNAFFISLFAMLLFSTALILYGGLYRSAEAQFLLTQPVRPERIFVYKFQEAVWFSSWGFLLMGSPMLIAYGIVTSAPWHYYALLLPFMVTFAYVPAGLGAIACLLVVNWLPRARVHALATSVTVLIAGAGWFVWSLATHAELNLMTPRWFQEISDRLEFTEQRLLPSWWLSAGLLESARGPVYRDETYIPWSEGLLFLLLLLANALFFHLVATWIAGRTYRSSFNRLQSEYTAGKKTRVALADRLVHHTLWFLPFQVRVLLVKEFRVFRRDPVQWMQFLIFFGLLALYFANIRRFTYNAGYSTMISFLNLAVVGLILSTFTTRFIFPMISLEGRRFWILGLLPLPRDTILRTKFLFAAGGSFVPCSLLILLSDWMLGVSTRMIVIHQVTCTALCFGLSGLAIGMGAMMPDLRETSPSKIAAGFGGTLNLVISALYIMVVVLLTAIPSHLQLAGEQEWLRDLAGPTVRWLASSTAMNVGTVATIFLGAMATVWPLRAGMRAFRELEF